MLNFFKKDKLLVFLLFILALLPRVISAVLSDQVLRGDEIDYSQLAIRILEGKPYQSDFPLGFTNARAPLYPLFISIIYLFTNQSVFAVKLVQAMLGAFTCIIVFLIAEDIFKDRRVSFGAGLIWAIYPPSVFMVRALISETFFTFLLALAILFLLKGHNRPCLKHNFFSGLFLGLAVLTKPVILAFVPFLVLWLRFKRAVVVMFFMILVIMPWTIRNYLVFKEFVLISTTGGLTFYGYNTEETLKKIYDPIIFTGSVPLTNEQKDRMLHLSEPQRDKYLYRLGWEFAKSHPKDFFKIRLISLKQFWHLWPETPARYKEYYTKVGAPRHPLLDKFVNTYLLYFIKILYHLPYNILFLGIFISLISSHGKRDEFRKSLLLVFLLVAMSLLYSINGSERYRLPTDPYVFILGLHGVFSFWKKR